MLAFLGLGIQEWTILALAGLLMFALPVLAAILALALTRKADRGREHDELVELEEEVEHLREEVERMKVGPGD
jgi:hypothetical protein